MYGVLLCTKIRYIEIKYEILFLSDLSREIGNIIVFTILVNFGMEFLILVF